MHIPRMLGICILIDGIAGVLISLPHFIVDEKMASNDVALPNTTLKDNSSNILCIERPGDHLGPEVGSRYYRHSNNFETVMIDLIHLNHAPIQKVLSKGTFFSLM